MLFDNLGEGVGGERDGSFPSFSLDWSPGLAILLREMIVSHQLNPLLIADLRGVSEREAGPGGGVHNRGRGKGYERRTGACSPALIWIPCCKRM